MHDIKTFLHIFVCLNYKLKPVKRHLCIILALTIATAALAQKRGRVSVDSVALARNGQMVQLAMDVSIGEEKMGRHDVVVVTPRMVGLADSTDFPPVVVMGRNAYYRDTRHGDLLESEDNTVGPAYKIRYKNGPRTEHYARTIAHQPWMDNSTLKLVMTTGTTCQASDTLLLQQTAFTLPPPDTTYVEHTNKEQEELTGTVSGQARIQFIVNKTDFVPTLANNQRELEKMHQSIIEVQNDKRVRITKYRIKGYASPEGSWNNNVRLAQGRTERVREFMVDQWGVPQAQIEISYEPEDWQGFREYVDQHRDEYREADDIISIIDSNMAPDPKLARIAARHPAAYRKLLQECFPQLRRTEYNIDYEWADIVERQGKTTRDTIVTHHAVKDDDTLQDDVYTLYKPTKPWMALKTNMLFDLLLTPNVEIEVPIGKRWSIMVEDWFPWYLHNKGRNAVIGRYIKPGRYMKTDAYELWTIGAELRYWLPRPCLLTRPALTGTFIGIYYANGKYDLEYRSKGDQGEFNSVGLTYGCAWPLNRHLNFEASISAGALWGPRRHYTGQYGDTHLIWQYTGRTFYAGPTKLKLSLVWLIPSLKRQQKGGAR